MHTQKDFEAFASLIRATIQEVNVLHHGKPHAIQDRVEALDMLMKKACDYFMHGPKANPRFKPERFRAACLADPDAINEEVRRRKELA